MGPQYAPERRTSGRREGDVRRVCVSRAWRGAVHAVAAACLLLSPAAAALCGEITGTVRDDRGSPILGAHVSISGDKPFRPGVWRREVTTDRSGAFTIRDVAPGDYDLTAVCTGYGSQRREVTMDADGRLHLDFRLIRACWLSGKIVLAPGARPRAANITMHFVRPSERWSVGITTGWDGRYRVECARPGLYDIFLRMPGYATVERRAVRLPPGQEITEVNFILDARPSTIAGVVYQPDGEMPKGGAAVWVAIVSPPRWWPSGNRPALGSAEGRKPSLRRGAPPAHTITGPDGTFEITDVPEGTYRVYAHAPGYMVSPAADEITVGRSDSPTGTKVTLKLGGTIRGTVYDREGRPLTNAQLSGERMATFRGLIGHSGVGITTDEHGRYAMDNLVPARYEFELKRDDGARAEAVVELHEAQLVTGLDFRFTLGATLTVLVIGPGGKPLTDAEVRCYEDRGPGRSPQRSPIRQPDHEGLVHFENITAGTHYVAAKSPSAAAAWSDAIVVAPEQGPIRLRMELKEGATIRGRVLSDLGQPVAGAEVSVACSRRWAGPTTSYWERRSLITDADGAFVVAHAAIGRWRLTAAAPSVATETVRLDVVDEGQYDAEIVVPRAWSGTLEGEILMPDGKTPVASTRFTVHLLARGREGESWIGVENIKTNTDGRFSLVVKRGIHEAKFVAKDLTPRTVRIQPSGRETVSVTVRLPPETGVRGRVALPGQRAPRQPFYVVATRPGQYAPLPEARSHYVSPHRGSAKVIPGQREWQIVGLEPGEYDIFTYAKGLAPSVPSRVFVTEGEMAETVVEIPPPPGAIAGRVVTGDGEPLPGVPVHFKPSGGLVTFHSPPRTLTDEQGRYRCDCLTPGPVIVEIHASRYGYATPPEQVTLVVPGETIENVDFELFLGGQVSGIVKRRDGQRLTGEYRVDLDMGPVPHRTTQVSADGTFKFDRVYPGVYDLYLERWAGDDFELVAGREGIVVAEAQTLGGIELVIDE